MRLSASIALVPMAALGVVLAAQRPPASEAVVVHTVRIDAVLTDVRGRFVDTLKTADFDLSEDGVAVPIESAQLVRAGQKNPGDSAPASGRLFAIYLDEYHVSPGDGVARARAALSKFVTEQLTPDDLFVVMKPLESLFDIHLTHDRDTAAHLVAAMDGRRGDYTARTDYEKNFMAGDPARVQIAREQVVVSALNALSVNFSQFGDGRKNIIIVTEALSRLQHSRGQEFLATLDTAIRAAMRSMTAVYVVDPRQAPTEDPVSPERQAMYALARQTGGLMMEGPDLDAELAEIAREASAYYLITYRSAHKEDGKFHPIRLRVSRPGIKVRARAGFWAPSSEDRLRTELLARSREAKVPLPPEPVRRMSPLIQAWFGMSQGDKGTTRVTFVWEPAARVPGDRSLRSPSRIELTALGTDNSLVFSGPILPSGSTATSELEGSAARAVFDAPPGRLHLRMKIQDETSQQIDTDVRDLSLRDWRVVAIGTPEVLRTRNALEYRAVDADPNATPVASREFSRAERLIIRFPTYAPAGERQTVTAKLLGGGGQTIREVPVQMAAMPDGRHRLDLALAGLPRGEYALELSAKCPAGEAKDKLEFRVTN